MKHHRRASAQQGAALLTAMLTVTLVATLAAGALWQQWRNVEVEAAERTRVQASWILTGALDWSRLILREDAINGGADYLSEPWAIALQEARLSTFLAADQNNNSAADAQDMQDAFLSGRINDLQARLNVTNLISNGQISPTSHLSFAKLFNLLGLPEGQLSVVEQNLLAAQNTAEPNAPLPLQRFEQLQNYGLSPASLEVLRPFVTVLPASTPVNLNTAPAEVLYACIPSLDMSGAQRLVSARARNHFGTILDAQQLLGELSVGINANSHSISTNYFEVLGRLRLGDNVVQERSVIGRPSASGGTTTIAWRERGSFALQDPAQRNTP
jgi:general secretion pathway protein K